MCFSGRRPLCFAGILMRAHPRRLLRLLYCGVPCVPKEDQFGCRRIPHRKPSCALPVPSMWQRALQSARYSAGARSRGTEYPAAIFPMHGGSACSRYYDFEAGAKKAGCLVPEGLARARGDRFSYRGGSSKGSRTAAILLAAIDARGYAARGKRAGVHGILCPSLYPGQTLL